MRTDLIIVGLENCAGCKLLSSRFPEIPYVEIPVKSEGITEFIELKKRVKQLRIEKFPALTNSGMTETFPVSSIDPDFD
jgi:hypothetical protein